MHAKKLATPKRRPLDWVRSVLLRALRLEQPAPADNAKSAAMPAHTLLMKQRAELGARLLTHDPKTQVVRHLFRVHDALRKHGWVAVEAMPAETLARALAEAEMLAEQEPTPMLESIVARLASIQVEILPKVESLISDWSRPMAPEVSESDFAEFEQMERSWVGTVPAAL